MPDPDYKSIGTRVEDLEKRVSYLEGITRKGSGSTAMPNDLDGKYGNPEVRKDPPRWKGMTQVGKTYSQCPPEYLDELASFFEWQATMDDKQGRVDNKGRAKSGFRRMDAGRARGWALRIRSGWGGGSVPVNDSPASPAAPANDVFDFGSDQDDDIGF